MFNRISGFHLAMLAILAIISHRPSTGKCTVYSDLTTGLQKLEQEKTKVGLLCLYWEGSEDTIRGQDMGSVKNRTEIIGVKAPKISNLQKKYKRFVNSSNI